MGIARRQQDFALSWEATQQRGRCALAGQTLGFWGAIGPRKGNGRTFCTLGALPGHEAHFSGEGARCLAKGALLRREAHR